MKIISEWSSTHTGQKLPQVWRIPYCEKGLKSTSAIDLCLPVNKKREQNKQNKSVSEIWTIWPIKKIYILFGFFWLKVGDHYPFYPLPPPAPKKLRPKIWMKNWPKPPSNTPCSGNFSFVFYGFIPHKKVSGGKKRPFWSFWTILVIYVIYSLSDLDFKWTKKSPFPYMAFPLCETPIWQQL